MSTHFDRNSRKAALDSTASADSHYTSHFAHYCTVRFRTVLITVVTAVKLELPLRYQPSISESCPRPTTPDSEAHLAPLKKFFFEHSKMWSTLPCQISRAPSAKWLGSEKCGSRRAVVDRTAKWQRCKPALREGLSHHELLMRGRENRRGCGVFGLIGIFFFFFLRSCSITPNNCPANFLFASCLIQ